MRLTGNKPSRTWTTSEAALTPRWAAAAIGLVLLAVVALDRFTGQLPFQHLYYLPIIVGALRFGRRGAWVTSVAAILLYHLANPVLLSFGHGWPDVVQIGLFVVIGLVTARIRDDAHYLGTLAGTDDLTGLHNLRAFEQRLQDAVRRAGATRSPLSVLVLDIDRLKALNDVHGHLAGAEAVRTVGRIIAAHTPPGSIACRYGGDEFVVALPGAALGVARTTAAAILGAVRASSPTLAGKRFPEATLSVSVGIACLQHAETSTPPQDTQRIAESLFQEADEALYEAKRLGRGRVSASRTRATVPSADGLP